MPGKFVKNEEKKSAATTIAIPSAAAIVLSGQRTKPPDMPIPPQSPSGGGECGQGQREPSAKTKVSFVAHINPKPAPASKHHPKRPLLPQRHHAIPASPVKKTSAIS